MAFDHRTGSSLNPASQLLSTLDCMEGPAGTAYTAAIDAAQAELDVRGRADASDVTVFMSDGEAKDAPSWAPANYKSQPCRSAIGRANGLRARGTNVYAIGYDIPTTGSAPYCKAANPTTGSATTTREAPEIRAIDALPAIANARQFYNQPDPDPMNAVLLAIAADLAQGRSRLTRLPQRPPQPRAAASG